MRGKNALKNTIYELLYQITIIIKGLIIPKMIIEVYGSNINGLISSITKLLSFIVLFDAGFNVVIKSHLYKPIVKKNKNKIENILYSANKIFQRIAKIFIIYVLLLLIIYPLIIKNYNWRFLDLLIIIISISTFCEYYYGNTYRLFIESSGKSYLVSLVNTILTIISSCLIIILIKRNVNIIFIKLIGSVIFIIKPLFFNLYVKRKYLINIKKIKREYPINDKWDGLAQHIAWVIFNNTDVLILTLFSTLSNISVYSIYSVICVCVRNIVEAITKGIDATFGNIIASGEKEILCKKFSMYEIIFFTIISIIFSCAIILIIPFVKIYTINITDINYVNITFGMLIILSEFIIALRLPYRALIHSIGHFKQTKKSAWIECLFNVFISVILVFKLGLIGVALGTFISSFVRTIYFIYYVNKKIIKRSIMMTIKKIVLVIIEITIIVFLLKNIIFTATDTLYFIITSLKTIMISTIIIFICNLIVYKNQFKNVIIYIANLIKTKSK